MGFNPLSLLDPLNGMQPQTDDYTKQQLQTPGGYATDQGSFAGGQMPSNQGSNTYGRSPFGGPMDMQAMMTQYQQMAQKLYPSNPLFGNSQFAQNHPRLAGALSGGIMAAANTHSGMTIGDNIAAVAQGVMAPQMYAHQQAMQQMMFPYEMMGKGLDMQYKMSEMQRNADYGRYLMEARAPLAWSQAQYNDARAGQVGVVKASGAPLRDIDGKMWSRMSDGSFQDADGNQGNPNIPQKQGNPSLWGTISAANSADPSVSGPAQTNLNTYSRVVAGNAANSAKGVQTAKQPEIDVDSELKDLDRTLNNPKPMTYSQYVEANTKGGIPTDFSFKSDTERQADYQNYFKTANQSFTQTEMSHNQLKNEYRMAARKDPSLTMNDFLQKRSQGGPTTGGGSRAQSPDGKKWNPTKGIYE
jgi:hypothetical protein